MVIDRFYCPIQQEEKSFQGRKNKAKTAIDFESAYLLDYLGMEYHVEILRVEQEDS